MRLTIRNICFALMAAIGIAALVAIGVSYHLWQITGHAQLMWAKFDRDRNEWSRALGRIRAEVGYGGMIHNFKDFVLTGKTEHAERAALFLGGAFTDLDQLDILAPDELKSVVAAVRKTLERYRTNLNVARGLVRQGLSPTEIDRVVRIDDTVAVQAFVKLGGVQETESDDRYWDISSKRRALNALLDQMGYGGMIHNLKNLILRQDVKFVGVTSQRIAGALRALSAYQRLGPTPTEWEAINTIEETMQAYLVHLQRIAQSVGVGRSPVEINASLDVDDAAAIQAIATLNREIVSENEREAANVRAELSEMHNLLTIANVSSLVLGGIFSALLAWVLFGKVVRPIGALQSAMSGVARGDLDVQLPTVGENDGTEIDAMFATLEDFRISERVARSTQARFSDLISNMRDMLVMLDRNWRIMFANPQAIETFETEPDTMQGSVLWDYLPEFSSFAYKQLIGASKTRQPINFEMFYPPLLMWLNVRTAPTVDGMVLYILNITRRKTAEEEIRRSESRVRSIVESVADGIITFDSGGIIKTANPAADRLFRMGDKSLVNNNIVSFVPNLESIMSSMVSSEMNENGKDVVEMKAYDRLGRDFPIEVSTSKLAMGSRSLFLCTIRDISQRKEVDRMKSELISTVSHELRTPITSIRGSLGLLRGGLAGPITDKGRELLTIALSNTERLLNLVNDLLDMEKLQSGRIEFEEVAVDLDGLVHQMIAECKSYADQYQVKFETVEMDKGAIVRGDRKRLGQVITNLLSNAAKFSHTSDRVDITMRTVNKDIQIRVQDFGIGIAPEFHGRIFERFSQADSSDTRRKGGTGLGLNISKMIVERHGGTITFESELGKGTTFIVTLPQMRDVPAASDAPGASQAAAEA